MTDFTFLREPDVSTLRGEPAPGTYRVADFDVRPGRRYVEIGCPSCRKGSGLTKHAIAADGTVAPSVVCPHEGCTFHVMARLADWTGETYARLADNPALGRTTEVPFPAGRRLRVLHHRAERHDFTTWEREFLEDLLPLLRPGMVVYDVGAEEGEFSALIGLHVGGKYVHLFEPSPGVWRNIREVWGANDLDGPAAARQAFVSDEFWPSAEVSRTLDRAWPACAEGPIQTEGAFSVVTERPDIGCVTVDAWASVTRQPPDLVIVDVEGAEVRVVRGMARTLAQRRPIVFVSVHPEEWIERIGGSRAELFRLFEQAGYSARKVSVDHEEHWRFDPVEGRP